MIDSMTLVVSSTSGIIKVYEVNRDYTGYYSLEETRVEDMGGKIHALKQDSNNNCVLYACEFNNTVYFFVCNTNCCFFSSFL